MPAWLDLLRKEVEALPKPGGIKIVAARIGYSRTAVSLVLADKYPGKTDRLAQRVMEVLGEVECPSEGRTIAYSECQLMRLREAPTHNPALMRHWRCCQSCPNNPSAVADDRRIKTQEVTV